MAAQGSLAHVELTPKTNTHTPMTTSTLVTLVTLAQSYGWVVQTHKNGIIVCHPDRPWTGDFVSHTLRNEAEVLELVKLGYAPRS